MPSALLQHMASQITRHYGAEVKNVDRPHGERIVWDNFIPDCRCLPFFESGTTVAECVTADGSLINAMDSERDVAIHTGEGVMLCDPEIRSLAELIEVIRYLENFAKGIHVVGDRFQICTSFKQIRFRDAFSAIGMAIPQSDGFLALGSADLIEADIRQEFLRGFKEHSFSLEKRLAPLSDINNASGSFNSGDVAILPYKKAVPFEFYSSLWSKHAGCRIPVPVLRRSERLSLLYAIDYLNSTSEGELLLDECLNAIATGQTPEASILAPTRTCDQTSHSISYRTTKVSTGKSANWTLYSKRNAEALCSTGAEICEFIEKFKENTITLLEEIQNPLPFLFDYPYFHLRSSMDSLGKTKFAQMLLSNICRIPLYLLIEEARCHCASEISDLQQQLTGKPPADGTIHAIGRKQVIQAQEFARRDGIVLQTMYERFGEIYDDGLSDLIERRNRVAHAPFDYEGFVGEVATKQFERIIKLLREIFSGISMIVPTSIQIKDGSKQVRAISLSHSRVAFEAIEFTSKQPAESFPCDTIVICNSRTDQSFPIKQLLTTKAFPAIDVDVGIFEKVKNGISHYTFVKHGLSGLPLQAP